MCMEDICIARKTKIIETNVAVTGVFTPVCDNDPDRIAVVISEAGGAPIAVVHGNNNSVSSGQYIEKTTQPYRIGLDTHGRLATDPISVRAPGGAGVIVVWQIRLEKECEK